MKTFTNYAEKKAKQILNLLQGYTKGIRITAILILLLMGVSNAWGKTVNGPRIYFDNSSMNMTSTQVYFVVGHNSFSRTYGPMTEISDTKLLYRDISSETYYNWGDATYVGFIQVGSKWGDGSWGSSNLTNATNYTAANTSWSSFDWQNTYYCKANSKGGAVTISYKSAGYSGIPKYNATQSAKVRNTTSESYSTVNGNWPATLKLKGTYLSGNGASGRSEISSTKSSDGDDKKVYGAVVTGKITHSYSNLSEDYQFDGWGTSTPAAGNTYEYHITAATTVYAFFTKKHAITFGVHSSGGGSISAKSGSTTLQTGNKIVGGSQVVFTALPSNGYQVEGWYSDANCTSKIEAAGTNTTYTLTALESTAYVYVKFKGVQYTVTLSQENATTAGTASVQATYGSAMPSATMPTRNGYTFKGYYDAQSGGTQYYKADGSSAKNWDKTAATILYAQWTAKDITINWNANGGSVTPTSSTYTYDGDAITLPTPSYAGHRFLGWFTAADGGTQITNVGTTNKPYTTVTYYAHWEVSIVEHTVTFAVGTGSTEYGTLTAATNSGNITSGSNIVEGTSVTFTATPNTGYEVEGWYTNAACTADKHDAGQTTYTTSITGATNVYVKFIEKTWSVTVAAGTGGSVSPSGSQTVGEVTGISINANPDNGYTFNQWTIMSGNGTLTDANSVTTIFKPTADATVEASFNETLSTLTTSNNYTEGNPGYDAPTATKTQIGVATTAQVTATTPSGAYAFTGWTLTNCERTDNGDATALTITVRSNGDGVAATVIANYEKIPSKTVYFRPKTDWKNNNPVIICDGNPTAVTSYDCAGEYYTAEVPGGTTNLKFGCDNEQTLPLTVPTDNKVLYDMKSQRITKLYLKANSNWKADGARFAAYFFGNGDKWVSMTVVAGQTNLYEVAIPTDKSYPSVIFCRMNGGNQTNGWSNKWNQTADLTIPTDGTNRADLPTNVNDGANVTWHTEWDDSRWKEFTAPTYNITLDQTDGGTIAVSKNSDITLNEQVTVTMTADPGYSFQSGTITIGTQEPQTISTTESTHTICGDAIITAEWKPDTHTVTFNANGHGTAPDEQSVDHNEKVEEPEAPTANGYTFGGWYKEADCTNAWNFNTDVVTADMTLYAKWTPTEYNITYIDLYGVTHSNPGTYTIESETITFTNPTSERTGYTFAGWDPTKIEKGSTDDKTVTAQWTINNYNITYTQPTNGSYTIKVGNGAAVTTNTTADYNTTITLENTPATGYHFSQWNINPEIDITNNTFSMPASDVTIGVTFAANTYKVKFDANGGTGTMPDQPFTYDIAQNLTANTFERTGYTFAGWAISQDGTVAYTDNQSVSNLTPTNNGTFTLYAQWTANTYTVTLQHSTIAGYGSGGTSSVTATYDAAMPTTTMPTAANGYAFMGYFDDLDGSGKQYYNEYGTSARIWDKDIDNTTLYAFFKKAEITSITLDKTLFESGETGYVTVTNHTIEPTPAGTVIVCWTLCYNNGTPVEGHEAIEEAGTVKFAIEGLSEGTYKIVASLRLNDCDGEELDRAEATFVVAGSYTVTIKYTCDGQEIAGRKTQEGYPSTKTEATAPEIGGYNFVAWVLGDGIYTTDELTSKTIKYTANYDGYLTATYEKKKLIFLDLSTLPNKDVWTEPHVYLYSSNDYWDGKKGIGATKSQCVAKAAMVEVPTAADIWYYEYEGVQNFNGFVAFTATDKISQEYFYDTEVIYRGDFSKGTPVFVPAEGQNAVSRNSSEGKDAKYYSKGHWTKYMGGTGYTLKIYNHKEVDGRKELMSVPFTGSSLYLPFTAIVDLEGGQTFGYKIVRDDDKWYKNDNDGTMTVNSHTNWPFIEDKNNGLACGIQTVAAGNHTFTLTLNATSGNFEVSVDYPVTVGDYRILYKDNTRTTYKPSDIKKAEELNPVTSFFIRPNSNPELKIQTAARVSNEGVTWYADNHIYFKPNANWKQNDAYFAARFNGTEEVWSVLNQNGDVYSCKIPNGANDVIFVRMNPNGSDATNNKLNWNNKWNQTGHLSLPKDKNEYTLNEGEWGNKLYLKPNSNWFQKDGNQKDPRFAAYFFNSNSDNAWVSMGNPVDGVYSCDIPAKVYKNVIFCRMNGGNETNDWNNKYNQSSDLIVPTDGKTLYTVKDGTWDNGGGSWSVKEGSWSQIKGTITDLTRELQEKLGEIKGDIKDAPDSVYTIHLEQNNGTFSVAKVVPYTGNFYIRVDAAAGKWYDYKTNPDNLMTYSAFSESDANSFGEKFSHYKTKWCPRGTNVKFVIANDYSPCISDTLARDLVRASGDDYMTEGGELYQEDGGAKDPVYDRYSANIRFMWNRKTNKISRAYLASSSNDSRQFLVLKGCQEIKDENGNDLSGNGDNHGEHRALLQDTQDWIYERTFMVQPGTRVKLYACYADATVSPATAQYFRGKHDGGNCGSTENSVQILGGNGEDWEKIRVIYDFKTNRLMGAWVPESAIDSEQAIAADLMVIRRHQENATCVTLTNENSKLTDVKTAYGAMQFNRWTINNRGGADDLDVEHCTKQSGSHRVYDEDITNQYHPVLPLAEQTSIYERGLYFISFPFDVHLSDVFGFGTYGTHWVISTYNGKRRAERGYFAEDCINEDCTNWDYIWDPTGFVMKANEGYLLSLDLDLMKHDNTDFWANNTSQVELFFPSTAAVKSIEKTDYAMPALTDEYLCKINHNTPDGDRRVKDSYWRCIGVPSFADYDGSLTTDGKNSTINWKADYTWQADNGAFPFLYEWNVTNNDLVVRSTNSYKFRATYAYLIQNGNEIHWEAVNTNKPASIIARDQTENVSNYEWKIALLRNDAPADHTFIRMTDNESVTSAFDFHQDLSKEFNYGANIYTLVGYERLAANSLPMSDSTTIIPLGVSAQEAGDYTIAMPEGVENIGITLVDNETGIHTNLSAGQEYTLTLNNGICENRLFIEVSPIQNTPTDLEYTTEDTREQTTRKVLINEKLYIIRDGVVYDAQGHRL